MQSERFDDLVVREENGKRVLRIQPKELPEWCGVPDVGFIPHNEWSDAEIEYKGEIFNVHDIEDALWDDYNYDCDDLGVDATDEGFAAYVKYHADDVYDMLNWLISERKEMKKR